jgi:hypothetical protein
VIAGISGARPAVVRGLLVKGNLGSLVHLVHVLREDDTVFVRSTSAH